MELYQKNAHELAELLTSGQLTATELTQSVLGQVKSKEEKIGAFITVTEEQALMTAQKVDKLRAEGKELPALAGIPMAAKDNFSTENVKTTCGSELLADYVPPFTATVLKKLELSPLLGKTNMDEFAFGSTTETSSFHPTRNPKCLERVPGGSSGGSAAAVAAGEAIFALGTDTGGSIRQPGAFCGIVGLKPTYGRVSRFGAMGFASSLDVVGPITRCVEDAALVLKAIAGSDPADSTTSQSEVPDYRQGLKESIAGLKIGLPKELFALAEPEIQAQLEEARKFLEQEGAVVAEVSLAHTEFVLPVYRIVSSAEASSNLSRIDGVRFGRRAEAPDVTAMYKATRSGLGLEAKLRVLLGTFATSSAGYEEYYLKALKARRLIANDFAAVFADYDCLLTPTTLTLPPLLGTEVDPLSDLCTVPASLVGLPALSLPGGTSGDLPVGLQLIGNHFQEELILRLGWQLEQYFGPGEVI